MRLAAPSALILALLVLAGCGSQAPPPSAGAPPAAGPQAASAPPAPPMPPPQGQVFAPFPFTAEQIREASPAGRHVVFTVKQQGQELSQEMLFVENDEEGAVVRSSMTLPDGRQQASQTRSGWDELMRHASYPASFTTVSPVEVEVGAGTFQAKLYEVGDGEGGVAQRAWFADELPGPPVRMEMYQGGRLAFEMEMVTNEQTELESEPTEGD